MGSLLIFLTIYLEIIKKNINVNDPTSLLVRLRIIMNEIRPVPASSHSGLQ